MVSRGIEAKTSDRLKTNFKRIVAMLTRLALGGKVSPNRQRAMVSITSTSTASLSTSDGERQLAIRARAGVMASDLVCCYRRETKNKQPGLDPRDLDDLSRNRLP